MKCEDIMKKNFKCVSPRDSIEDAAKRMRDEGIGFLPVCDQSKKALGTITDRDIAIRIVAEGKQASSFVEDAMTRQVVACKPGDDLSKAQQLMAQHKVSRLMCIDDSGELCGVISLSDIAQKTGASDTLKQVSEREARS